MIRSHRTVATTLILAAAGLSGHAQPPAQRAADTVKVGVTAVLVDVVVRDRRGQPVRDLTQADFEVLEDGVPQPIGSFTTHFDAAGAPVPPAAPAVSAPGSAVIGSVPSGARGPIVTALVFDRLGPEARRLAVQAAQEYLASKDQLQAHIGVFGVDLALTPYAPFTRSREVLRQALDRVASLASSRFNSQDQRDRQAAADQRASAAEQAVARAVSAGGPVSADSVGGAAAEAMFAQMESSMLRDFDIMERDQQGYTTTNGLLSIIGTLRRLPGRKSLVFFSEGLAIPPAVHRLFQGVIDAANRANVSIYAMDAAGLRAESEQAKIRDQVNQAASVGINTGYASSSGRSPLIQRLEKNEDVLRQDPHTGLATLSQDTGGLFFDNTNNLREGFTRIETDLRNYYLLGYAPTNDRYDGRFRAIEVKVKRPGLTVAARKGYFAVRDPGVGAINAWEAPALAALEQKPVPNAFPTRAAALLFPEASRPGLVAVIAEVRTAGLTFQPASDAASYTSDFTILVRFVDQQNQVARQVSQHYELKGALAEIDRARQGEIVFYREPELAPGTYSMEAVVYDAPSGRSSVRFATVEVRDSDVRKLRMSSLMLVKRGEKLDAGERRSENPLLVNDIVVYPNLGEPVAKALREVGLYFAIYPVAGGPVPETEIHVLQNGALLARVPMPSAAPDATGRIPQLGRLPIDRLQSGTYELRAVVKQGPEQASRSTILRIVEP